MRARVQICLSFLLKKYQIIPENETLYDFEYLNSGTRLQHGIGCDTALGLASHEAVQSSRFALTLRATSASTEFRV